jgi:predicted ATPase/class 3 adenylate cyclase
MGEETGGKAIPSGLVGFLFTDVEGSTSLWAADREAMSASLEVHDRLMREVVESHGGYVFTTAGDSFAVAFDTATDAVAAAVAAQEVLGAASWPGPTLKVRMGIHLGEAEERAGDYFGPVVNLTARLEAAAHGGQVLVSEQVRVAAGIEGLNLGVHELRDVPEPVHVHQVGDGEFPPLRIVASNRTNLPAARTRLIGRDEEVVEIRAALGSHRLITLTAGGGTGKTRLALAVGEEELPHRRGGVWFVDLLRVSDEGHVPAAVAAGLGLVLVVGDPTEQIVDYLEGLDALVILDNCEHVVDACAELVGAILDRPGRAVVLATSREFLDVDGERAIRLGSLGSEGGSNFAVDLFVERAAARDSGFDPEADRDVVAELCRHLDGLPLAIELAAARCGVMSPRELLEGISERFELLGGGRRRRVQRTLEDTLDWSYDLLDEEEQHLFRHLGVFAGVFDADGVAAVTGVSRPRALDLLDSLIAKSLVVAERSTGSIGFRLLETTAAYCERRLTGADEAEAARTRHLDHHLAVLEPFYLVGAWPDARVVEVVEDPDDVRAAAEWAQRKGRWVDVASLVFAALPVLYDRAEDARDMVARAFAELGESEHRVRYLALWAWFDLSAFIDDFVGIADSARAAASQRDPPCLTFERFVSAFVLFVRDPETGLVILDGAEDVAGQVKDPITRDELFSLIAGMRGWTLCQRRRLSEGVDSLETAIALGSRSDRRPTALPGFQLSLLCAHVALGDPSVALAIAQATRSDSRYIDENLPLALAELAAGDLENALPLVRAHTARAVTGRLSREANDSLLLLSMLARVEGNDDHARRLLPEVRVGRNPGTIVLSDHLADLLGVRTELDEAQREVLDDRVEGGHRALAALKSEMNRRGWST